MAEIQVAASLQGIDWALFTRACDFIEKHPRNYDPSFYECETKCGTVCCFAGWVCALSGRGPDSEAAISLLGGSARIHLAIWDADLFGTSHRYFPEPFLSIANNCEIGSPEYARNAANRFRHFLRSGE